MTEYIVGVPPEDAERFVSRFGIDGTRIFGYRLAGEITRCRDCKHAYPMYDEDGNEMPDMRDCHGKLTTPWDDWNDCPMENPVEPEGFCAWGGRRDA